jgi:hypothetical protein
MRSSAASTRSSGAISRRCNSEACSATSSNARFTIRLRIAEEAQHAAEAVARIGRVAQTTSPWATAHANLLGARGADLRRRRDLDVWLHLVHKSRMGFERKPRRFRV